MLGVIGFSKYGTFTLTVSNVRNAGNIGDLRIIYNNMFYLSFPKKCFAGLGKLVQLMEECTIL
jgi:hypothetical protein